MTIAEQDRQLAERIAGTLAAAGGALVSHDEAKDRVATLIAEARETQHKASWKMAIYAARGCTIPRIYGRNVTVQDLRNAIATLPTPPITNEGE